MWYILIRIRLVNLPATPLDIEESLPKQVSKPSCTCVRVVSIFPLFMILIFDFKIVSTVLYLLSSFYHNIHVYTCVYADMDRENLNALLCTCNVLVLKIKFTHTI